MSDTLNGFARTCCRFVAKSVSFQEPNVFRIDLGMTSRNHRHALKTQMLLKIVEIGNEMKEERPATVCSAVGRL